MKHEFCNALSFGCVLAAAVHLYSSKASCVSSFVCNDELVILVNSSVILVANSQHAVGSSACCCTCSMSSAVFQILTSLLFLFIGCNFGSKQQCGRNSRLRKKQLHPRAQMLPHLICLLASVHDERKCPWDRNCVLKDAVRLPWSSPPVLL